VANVTSIFAAAYFLNVRWFHWSDSRTHESPSLHQWTSYDAKCEFLVMCYFRNR